jgi:hypothetical protein
MPQPAPLVGELLPEEKKSNRLVPAENLEVAHYPEGTRWERVPDIFGLYTGDRAKTRAEERLHRLKTSLLPCKLQPPEGQILEAQIYSTVSNLGGIWVIQEKMAPTFNEYGEVAP